MSTDGEKITHFGTIKKFYKPKEVRSYKGPLETRPSQPDIEGLYLDNFKDFYIRPSSEKDLLLMNYERFIFINSNFKVFRLIPSNTGDDKLQFIANTKKFSKVDQNTFSFIPFNEDGE